MHRPPPGVESSGRSLGPSIKANVIFIMFLLLMLGGVLSERITEPKYSINWMQSRGESHRINVNEELKLYLNYTDAYQIRLLRWRDAGERVTNYTEEDLTKMEEEEAKLEGIPGCNAQQRIYETQIKYRIRLPTNGSLYYTDMIVLQNRALLIRNDYYINEVSISHEGFTKVHAAKQLNLASIADSPTHPHFLHNPLQKRVYVVSESGGVSFPSHLSLQDSNFFVKEEGFVKRNVVYSVFMKKKRIYVACGTQGLDVYSTDQGVVKFESNLNKFKELRLHAVDVKGDDDYLYVLDYENGLIVFDYQFNVKTVVVIQYGSDFDFYGSTFYIIAQSLPSNYDYAVEVFLDFADLNYYVNKYVVEEMKFYDVKVYPSYAILIGYDAHEILYHSIYQDLVYDRIAERSYFEQPQLLQINSWEEYLITMSKRDLRMLNIVDQQPYVICSSPRQIQEWYAAYVFRRGKTQFDATVACHGFRISVLDNSLLNKENTSLGLTILIIAFCVVWFGLFLLLCYLGCRKRAQQMAAEVQKLKDQYNLDKSNGPAQVLQEG